MADLVTAEINAVFDELWKERNDAIAQLSWPAKGMAEAAMTRERTLASARAAVAAAEKT